MKINKINIVIGFLALITLLLISNWVLVYANIKHSCSFTTTAITGDFIKTNITYTVKYKAPIILPENIKLDAERKIKIYTDLRICGFVAQHTAHKLKETNLNLLQNEFDAKDELGDIIRSLGIPDVTDKINKIRSVKINSIIFEKYFEDIFKKRNKAKEEVDSLKNITLTLRQKGDLDAVKIMANVINQK